MTDFGKYLTDYLNRYLTMECGCSYQTVKQYSVTFMLFIQYMYKIELIAPEKLCLKEFTKERVLGFLHWLEDTRKCSISTRNNRLCALRSFFKYLQYREVKGMAYWQAILSIKQKKTPFKEMSYLTTEGVRVLLEQPDLSTRKGRRDFVLMGLLYDSGARVQEIINLTPENIRLGETTTVKLHGKGNKIRVVPLSTNQVKNLRLYMDENNLFAAQYRCHPLFPNPKGERLTRMAVLDIVKRHAENARKQYSELIPNNISCHTFRHSKAMHMLEAGINLVYIRDFLGHTSTTTTEIYARASEKIKEQALKKLTSGIIQESKTTWQKDGDLMEFLKALQVKYK